MSRCRSYAINAAKAWLIERNEMATGEMVNKKCRVQISDYGRREREQTGSDWKTGQNKDLIRL